MMAALLTTAVLAGCLDDPTVPREPRVDASVIAARQGAVRSAEQIFADLAQVSPSSAGFYFDEDGQAVVVVRDPNENAAARSFVLDRLASRRFAGLPPLTNVVFQEGEYSFSELSFWRDQIFESVFLGMEGVTTLDLNEKENRIDIGLDPDSRGLEGEVRQILGELGIDQNAVQFLSLRPTHSVALNAAVSLPSTLSGSVDTIVGGIKVDHRASPGCTAGFTATQGGTDILVGASHCSPTFYGLDSSEYWQPDSLPGRYIGYEEDDPDRNLSTTMGHSTGLIREQFPVWRGKWWED